MTRPTDNLSVLVTRPVQQAKRLSRLIERAGGVVHPVPVIEILPAEQPAAVQEAIGDVSLYSLFVFVSTNAVRYALDYLPVDVKLPGSVAAVGPTTAQALVRAGLGCDVKPRRGYTSEDLLREKRLQDVSGQKVLIFRGAGGRALLGDTLAERGAEVTYANVYRRRLPTASTQEIRQLVDADAINVVTATSVETLCNIVEMAGDDRGRKLRGLTVLTASPRVVKKAAELGFEREALLARGPDDKSLVAALVAWRQAGETNVSPPGEDPQQTQDSVHKLPENDAMASDDKQEGAERVAGQQSGVGDSHDTDADGTTADSDDSAGREPPAESTLSAGAEARGKEAGDESSPPAAADGAAGQTAGAAARPPKSGRALAALALLLALLAVAASGYNWWRTQSMRAAVEEEMRGAIATAVAGLPDEQTVLAQARQQTERAGDEISRSVEQRLARVDLSAMDELRGDQDRLDGSLRGQQRSVTTLTDRLSGLEQDISAMQGVSASVRNTWVRAEAEYFLQTANSRLQLANDLESALQALRAADERIGALGDPGLTPVRALLTEEILAVEGVPRPDVQGMALVLNGMTARVRELPFRAATPDNFSTRRTAETETPNGWQRARETVGEVFTGIVRVSPSDGSALELLAPDESWFLVRNLELQLQVARMALMEKDVENFRGSVQTAMNWLDEYFAGDDPSVRSMRARLAAMEQVNINPEVPDISASLRLLRQIVAASSASQ